MKKMYVFAGNNGSGKSTYRSLILDQMDAEIHVDNDRITKNLKESSVKNYHLEAGRQTIQLINECIEIGKNFSMETTLSGKLGLEQIKQAKQKGYFVTVYFIILPEIFINMERIRRRVADGGHDIPSGDVLRRKDRVIKNLKEIYSHLDVLQIIDNSGLRPNLILEVNQRKIKYRQNVLPKWLADLINKKY
ncbi:MAG: zeta toxin family protein [Sporolactobacillus sp.]